MDRVGSEKGQKWDLSLDPVYYFALPCLDTWCTLSSTQNCWKMILWPLKVKTASCFGQFKKCQHRPKNQKCFRSIIWCGKSPWITSQQGPPRAVGEGRPELLLLHFQIIRRFTMNYHKEIYHELIQRNQFWALDLFSVFIFSLLGAGKPIVEYFHQTSASKF